MLNRMVKCVKDNLETMLNRNEMEVDFDWMTRKDGCDLCLEITLHHDKENNRYLLENRIFDKKDRMADSLLLVMSENGKIISDEELGADYMEHEDVWIFDWEVIDCMAV